jgi:hypothetical protein
MYTALFYIQALLQTALLLWLLRIRRRTGAAAATVLLIPQLGLVYDNLIVAAGSSIGLGGLLQALSWPRFWIHWLFGSWLIIASGAILRLAGVAWARSRGAMATFCLLTVALMAYDLPLFWKSRLYPVCELGLVRYSTAVPVEKFCFPDQLPVKSEFPLAAVTTCIIVIFAGAELLRRRRFPWMMLGAMLMFISATPLLARLKLDNFGEVLIAGGCIWAIARYAQPPTAA